jgi:cytochrome bd ubiquinol oxidase subunit I
MDLTTLSRMQFGIVTVYHFFFVPLTLGLSIMVAIMETMYVRSGKEVYLQMTKFWGKLFLINFAMGVVTGIVQEFQFGMNWSEYSRFVGDIFGAPLAIEALLAFFMESVFLGLWIFGWNKVSKGIHLTAIWLVAIGSNVSALWILIANSFMQQPVGYTIANGRAVMTDFLALITNPNVLVMFPHTISAGLCTAAFFVLAFSAYHLLRKNDVELFQRSFQLGAIIGTIGTILVILNGHAQAQHMVQSQPMKMASAEALWQTESPASFSLLTIGNLSQTADVFAIRIPRGLCLLAYNSLNCTVKGINDLQAEFVKQFGPGDYTPPVAFIYWTFRLMVGAGFLMLALVLYALYMVMKNKFEHPRALKFFTWAVLLPYLANTTGWLMTELGRQPWIVYGLMIVDKGVSTVVPAWQVLATMLGYTLVYAALMVAAVYLLLKFGKAGPVSVTEGEPGVDDSMPALVGAQD